MPGDMESDMSWHLTESETKEEINTWQIKGHTLEYIDNIHTYIVDGYIVPSITQIMKIKFGNKYDNVDKEVLERASQKGTAVHEAIEKYCKTGEVEDIKEVKDFMFLQKQYGFEVLDNEVPIILFEVIDGVETPIAAGRLDLVLKIGDKIGGGDIKRTSTLDKEYLAYQLNLYRIGYWECYGVEWEFLKGIHLREGKRKFVDIKINEDIAWELVNDYLEGEDNE